jgi:calcineurin-like phosphoesterase family protein
MAQQPMIWFSSDLHFRHRMVAGKRGFGTDADAHDETIVENWNELVGQRDVAFILGDVTLGRASLAWPYVDRLNGVKHLITGNHDACSAVHRDGYRHLDEWSQHFATIQALMRRRLEGQDVFFSHYPYQGAGDHTETERYTQYRLPDLGGWLVHGHTHAADQVNGRMIHVGLDAHKLRPVSLGWVQKVIREATA